MINKELPEYTVAIRTLGKAGDMFEKEISSLLSQRHGPKSINAYIPDGYERPVFKGSENVSWIASPKGMITQRSLPFDEVTTDYILFLDDDLELAPDSVEKMLNGLLSNNGDAISANVFANHTGNLLWKIRSALMGTLPMFGNRWGFRIRRSGYYSYNNSPDEVMESQSGAGACILIRKDAYTAIHFCAERWMEKWGYCLGEDQMFFYKLYSRGYKVLTHFDAGVIHLDAGSSHVDDKGAQYRQETALRYIIWHRSIYKGSSSIFKRVSCRCSFWGMFALLSLTDFFHGVLKCNFRRLRNRMAGIRSGVKYVQTEEYGNLPSFKV